MSISKKDPLFVNPMETSKGLTINDLNKYLPALRKIDDFTFGKNPREKYTVAATRGDSASTIHTGSMTQSVFPGGAIRSHLRFLESSFSFSIFLDYSYTVNCNKKPHY